MHNAKLAQSQQCKRQKVGTEVNAFLQGKNLVRQRSSHKTLKRSTNRGLAELGARPSKFENGIFHFQ